MATRKNDQANGHHSESTTLGAFDSFGMRGVLVGALHFYESLDTPRSLACAMMLQAGEFHQLVRQTINPKDYLHAHAFRKDYAATKYLSKLQGLCPKSVLEEVALGSFKSAEERCRSTNNRIWSGNPIKGAEALIYNVREKISRILGKVNYEDLVALCDWGPGATATITAQDVRPENKLLEPRISVTRALLPLAVRLVGSDLHWTRARLGDQVDGQCSLLFGEFEPIDYMRVVTVDKDSKTDRTIGAEPTFNTYVQKGIGKLIRRKLRRVGINLDDQSINQTWAELALDLDLATVDLSSASDLISYALVELLIPPEWFRLLVAARSGFALLPPSAKGLYPRLFRRRGGPQLLELEKFSSMGNGYTFELETLIFFALAKCVCEELGLSTCCVSVYGDDIVVPQAAYSRLVEVFQLLGFRINTEKSYADGLFFESCGKHYFNGVDVTPCYQKETVDDLPQLVRAHNRLVRWGNGSPETVYVDLAVKAASSHYKRLGKIIMTHLDCGPHKGPRPGLTVPEIPWGTEGDDGFWSFSAKGFFCYDRGILCKVVKMEPLKVATTSYDALLALDLRRRAGTEPPWKFIRAGKRLTDLSRITETQPWEGQVTLRGLTGHRLARRWIKPPLTRKHLWA